MFKRIVPVVYLLFFAMPFFSYAQSAGDAVVVRKEGTTVFLENGKLRCKLASQNGSVAQQLYAKKGGGWELIMESFDPPTPFPAKANPLLNSSKNSHRLLVNRAKSPIQVITQSSNRAVVAMPGLIGSDSVTQLISLNKGEENLHYEIRMYTGKDSSKLEYLLSTFVFNHKGAPEFVHTPTLKYEEERWVTPAEEQIIGDRSYHSPAMVLQQGQRFAAIVPDLEAINAHRILSPDARRNIRIPRNVFSVPFVESKYTMPTGLDMNVNTGLTDKPVLAFGYIDNIIQHHVRYLHPDTADMVRTVQTRELVYAFDVFVSATKKEYTGFQDVTRFIWNKYGSKEFSRNRHLAMPIGEYVNTISEVTFSPGVQPAEKGFPNTGSFLELEIDGQPAGGFRSAVPGWTDALWNSVFWNNARDASGMYYWGKARGDSQLVKRARMTINTILLSPQNNKGLFPLIYRAGTKQWQSASYDIISGKNGLFSAGPESKTYDVVAMSKTSAHLLDYYNSSEADQRIIKFCSNYANWLVTAVDQQGTVPSYVSTDMKSSDILRVSAQPASSMWFLAELYSVTKKPAYLDAAKRIAAYLQKNILPRQNWIDLEQYFSCGIKSLSFTGDEDQGQLARGNLSVGWAAEGFAALFRATGNKDYLRAGESCVDYLSFTQCSWNPHYIYTAYAFGGFSVDNSDHATYLDARQAEYVKPMAWYGLQLGRQDLLERAVAAARSSVILINHPLHKMNGIYEYTNIYPFGLGPENIDHEAHPQSAMRTHASWGEGSGIFSGLYNACSVLGSGYIDLKRNIQVGVDGIYIDSVSLAGKTLTINISSALDKLPVPWNRSYDLELRIEGLPSGNIDLVLNGKKYSSVPAKQLAKLALRMEPDGKITRRVVRAFD